jgi:hypothetical protein
LEFPYPLFGLALARSSAHFASDLVEWTDMRHSDGYANLRLRRPA